MGRCPCCLCWVFHQPKHLGRGRAPVFGVLYYQPFRVPFLDIHWAPLGQTSEKPIDLARIYDGNGSNDGQLCCPHFYIIGDVMRKSFEGVENLEAAYDLETPEDNVKLYAAWADTYDTGYRASMRYILHSQIAKTYHQVAAGPKVLDIGAGTGALAEALIPLGPYEIDATDISQPMLDVAAQKGLYRRVFWSDVTAGLPIKEATYDGVVSSGTFTLGHVGPEAIEELLRVTKIGGHIVISVNEQHWHALHFDRVLGALENQYEFYETQTVAIYSDVADHEHKNDLARALIIKK